MKVIFLDIDGVLNCKTSRSRCGKHIGIDDDKLLILAEIANATGAEVVLISTWKNHWQKLGKDKFKQDNLANYLDKKFKKHGLEVYDKTADSRDGVYFSRGESILDFIYGHKIESYVILDDLQFDFDSCNLTDSFVKTDIATGITAATAAHAIELLNQP